MKNSCEEGRDDNIFSGKGKGPALMLALFLLLIGTFSLSPTGISGDVSEEIENNIVWDTNITIDQGDFVVGPDETLTIEPGVIVFIRDGLGIDVSGKMIAKGSPDRPIQFTKVVGPSYPRTYWRSIAFLESEGSVLENVYIDMAKTALHIISSSLKVENSRIQGSHESNVVVNSRMGGSSRPTFINCTIGASIPYFNFDISGNSWVRALNTTYDENLTKISEPESVLERQWFFDVQVDNSLSEKVADALALAEDNENGTAILSEYTSSEGHAIFALTEYTAHMGYFSRNRTYHTPHNITVSKAGYQDSRLGPIWVDRNMFFQTTLVDITPPTTTLVTSGPTYESNPTYVSGATSLKLEVEQTGILPIQTWFELDNSNNWIPYSGGEIILAVDGAHDISYYSRDPINEESPRPTSSIYLDTQPPDISRVFDLQGEGSDPIVFDTAVELTLEASDSGSGVSYLRYSINGGPYQDYVGQLNLSDLGDYHVGFVAEDNVGNLAEENLFVRITTPIVPPVNNPPYFTSIPEISGRVGKPYTYNAEAIDLDGDYLTYSLLYPPDGMTIDDATGFLSWIPKSGQEGTNEVRVLVTDGHNIDIQFFVVKVDRAETPASRYTLTIYSSLGIVLAAGVLLIGATEYGRFRFLLFFLVPLYSKLRKGEVLNQFLRGQIYGYIMAYPGENYSSIRKALNIGNGTLTHHLYILEREGYVDSRVDGRYKRFYPTGLGIKRRTRPRTSMIQKAILQMIKQNPRIAQTEIAEALETSKQVVNYHIRGLEKIGLVKVSREGSTLKYEVQSR